MHSCCCVIGLGLGLNLLVLFPSLLFIDDSGARLVFDFLLGASASPHSTRYSLACAPACYRRLLYLV